MNKYSVHIYGNGSTGYARDYVVLNSLAAVKEAVRVFVRELGATNSEDDHGAWADVYQYDERDSVDASYGDYPLTYFVTGKRGGIKQVRI